MKFVVAVLFAVIAVTYSRPNIKLGGLTIDSPLDSPDASFDITLDKDGLSAEATSTKYSEDSSYEEQNVRQGTNTREKDNDSERVKSELSEVNKTHATDVIHKRTEKKGLALDLGGASIYDKRSSLDDKTEVNGESGRTELYETDKTDISTHSLHSGSEYTKTDKSHDVHSEYQNKGLTLGTRGAVVEHDRGSTDSHEESRREAGSRYREENDYSKEGNATRISQSIQKDSYQSADDKAITHKEQSKDKKVTNDLEDAKKDFHRDIIRKMYGKKKRVDLENYNLNFGLDDDAKAKVKEEFQKAVEENIRHSKIIIAKDGRPKIVYPHVNNRSSPSLRQRISYSPVSSHYDNLNMIARQYLTWPNKKYGTKHAAGKNDVYQIKPHFGVDENEDRQKDAFNNRDLMESEIHSIGVENTQSNYDDERKNIETNDKPVIQSESPKEIEENIPESTFVDESETPEVNAESVKQNINLTKGTENLNDKAEDQTLNLEYKEKKIADGYSSFTAIQTNKNKSLDVQIESPLNTDTEITDKTVLEQEFNEDNTTDTPTKSVTVDDDYLENSPLATGENNSNSYVADSDSLTNTEILDSSYYNANSNLSDVDTLSEITNSSSQLDLADSNSSTVYASSSSSDDSITLIFDSSKVKSESLDSTDLPDISSENSTSVISTSAADITDEDAPEPFNFTISSTSGNNDTTNENLTSTLTTTDITDASTTAMTESSEIINIDANGTSISDATFTDAFETKETSNLAPESITGNNSTIIVIKGDTNYTVASDNTTISAYDIDNNNNDDTLNTISLIDFTTPNTTEDMVNVESASEIGSTAEHSTSVISTKDGAAGTLATNTTTTVVTSSSESEEVNVDSFKTDIQDETSTIVPIGDSTGSSESIVLTSPNGTSESVNAPDSTDSEAADEITSEKQATILETITEEADDKPTAKDGTTDENSEKKTKDDETTTKETTDEKSSIVEVAVSDIISEKESTIVKSSIEEADNDKIGAKDATSDKTSEEKAKADEHSAKVTTDDKSSNAEVAVAKIISEKEATSIKTSIEEAENDKPSAKDASSDETSEEKAKVDETSAKETTDDKSSNAEVAGGEITSEKEATIIKPSIEEDEDEKPSTKDEIRDETSEEKAKADETSAKVTTEDKSSIAEGDNNSAEEAINNKINARDETVGKTSEEKAVTDEISAKESINNSTEVAFDDKTSSEEVDESSGKETTSDETSEKEATSDETSEIEDIDDKSSSAEFAVTNKTSLARDEESSTVEAPTVEKPPNVETTTEIINSTVDSKPASEIQPEESSSNDALTVETEPDSLKGSSSYNTGFADDSSYNPKSDQSDDSAGPQDKYGEDNTFEAKVIPLSDSTE